MADNYYFLLISAWLFTAFIVHYLVKTFITHRTATIRHPPSPWALPIIGHLHLLGPVVPKTFQNLARLHGPLMRIHLGASTCVVASNADVAKQIFKTQELNFVSRPEFGSSEYFIYRGSRFIMAQYGDYWRFMKKLCVSRLLSVAQLGKFADVREQELARLVESVTRSAREGTAINLALELTTFTNNCVSRMAMSTQCSGKREAEEIKKLVETCLKLAGRLSVGDVLGPLKFLDISGNGKKLRAALMQYDRIVERIIKEHEEKAMEAQEAKDLMDILLEIYKDPAAELKLTKKDIKSFFLDILMAGTDTTSSVMQWAIAELLSHPEVFHKVREEIGAVVGPNRLVKESDIPNLPYLRAVMKESLRLHPSAPLIIRECAENCEINGYHVPAKTRVLVNVYAVMRDPDSWKDPDEFVPERFLESSTERIGDHQMEYKGQNFRFLPFGSGRRGCAGASLAMELMHVGVGALVQCFDWKMKDSEKIDLREGPGFSSEMAIPLVCYPTIRFNPFSAVA